MIFPFPPIFDRPRGCLISVDVICDLRRIITKCADGYDKEQQEPRPMVHGHATSIKNTSRRKLQQSPEAKVCQLWLTLRL